MHNLSHHWPGQTAATAKHKKFQCDIRGHQHFWHILTHLCNLLIWCDIDHELAQDGVEADGCQEHHEVVKALLSLSLEAYHGVYHWHEQQCLWGMSAQDDRISRVQKQQSRCHMVLGDWCCTTLCMTSLCRSNITCNAWYVPRRCWEGGRLCDI